MYHELTKKNTASIALSVSAKIAKCFLLCLCVVIVFVPILAVFFGSFKGVEEFYISSALTLPESFSFANYKTAFIDGKMLEGFLNTLIIMAFSLILSVMTGSMTAFALGRYRFFGKAAVHAMFLAASLIPVVTTQVLTFRIANALNLVNTYTGAVLMFGGTDIISVYIFLQFLNRIPVSLDESAKIDGANAYRIFFTIVLPLMLPAIVTVLIIKFVGIYNEFYIPLIYIPDVHMVSTALYNFTSAFGSRWEVICAGQIIVIIPMVIVFLFLQKYIYSGLTAGAIKE